VETRYACRVQGAGCERKKSTTWCQAASTKTPCDSRIPPCAACTGGYHGITERVHTCTYVLHSQPSFLVSTTQGLRLGLSGPPSSPSSTQTALRQTCLHSCTRHTRGALGDTCSCPTEAIVRWTSPTSRACTTPRPCSSLPQSGKRLKTSPSMRQACGLPCRRASRNPIFI
jgi:hypothetical protein